MNPEFFFVSSIMGKAGEKIRPHNMCVSVCECVRVCIHNQTKLIQCKNVKSITSSVCGI